MSGKGPNPFEESRRIGTVTSVTPLAAIANLPHAAATPLSDYGARIGRGEVGEYVAIARGDLMVLGRIIEVRLPERDRLTVEPRLGRSPPPDPIGEVALLTDVDLASELVTGAVGAPPRVGAAIYSVTASILSAIVEWSTRADTGSATGPPLLVRLGRLPSTVGIGPAINMSPERLFGRHCAVLGATGGGKSFTLSRLIESCREHRAKILLIDATGEYYRMSGPDLTHMSIGMEIDKAGETGTAADVVYPHHQLDEADLFALFTPSGQSQVPVLRDAIRSLKLAAFLESMAAPQRPPDVAVVNGLLPKAGKLRAPILDALRTHAEVVEGRNTYFDATLLSTQIDCECIWPTPYGTTDQTRFGLTNPGLQSNCATLRTRVEGMVRAPEYKCVFQHAPNVGNTLHEGIRGFLDNANAKVLRVSLRFLPFARDVRPVLVNAIGRLLLDFARDGKFRTRPLIVFLDEAHQFLDRVIGDETNRHRLEAFDAVAKEGRKYGLTLCLATQRPRDIHESVLSQMGTMIVHRMSHPADREVVEKSARDIERSAATFMPTLAPGVALIIGAGMPIPIPVQMDTPSAKPDSRGPDFQTAWAPPTPTPPATGSQRI